jgi:hypothetical protein
MRATRVPGRRVRPVLPIRFRPRQLGKPSDGIETYVNVNVPVNVHDGGLSGIETSRVGAERLRPNCDASIIVRPRSFTFTGTFTFT